MRKGQRSSNYINYKPGRGGGGSGGDGYHVQVLVAAMSPVEISQAGPCNY